MSTLSLLLQPVDAARLDLQGNGIEKATFASQQAGLEEPFRFGARDLANHSFSGKLGQHASGNKLAGKT